MAARFKFQAKKLKAELSMLRGYLEENDKSRTRSRQKRCQIAFGKCEKLPAVE